MATPYIECLIRNIIDVLKGIPVLFANTPCPVKGKNINNGANVVRAPNKKPEKQVISIPIIKKQK